MDNLILATAPNGAYKTKKNHPQLPISDDEIINFTINAQKLGVNMLHLHIRDNKGRHSLDAEHYKNILAKMPKKILLQVTSEAAGIFNTDEQVKMIKSLKPKFVSIAVREIIKLGKDKLQEFFLWMKNNNVNPQLIIYNPEDAQKYLEYLKKGIWIGKSFPVLFVAGRENKELTPIFEMKKLTKNKVKSWMVCGFEALEEQVTNFALKNSGHIRIGFENNLLNNSGELAKNNETQIMDVLKLIKKSNETLASYKQTTELMTPKWYE